MAGGIRKISPTDRLLLQENIKFRNLIIILICTSLLRGSFNFFFLKKRIKNKCIYDILFNLKDYDLESLEKIEQNEENCFYDKVAISLIRKLDLKVIINKRPYEQFHLQETSKIINDFEEPAIVMELDSINNKLLASSQI